MKLIHYGSAQFDAKKFKPIQNADYPSTKPKPGTGLWASPLDSDFGWRDWCKQEKFRDCDEKDAFEFSISTKNILVVDGYEDIRGWPLHPKCADFSYNILGFDFVRLARACDAIWLTIDGLTETRFSGRRNLYGWDCESVLILNPEIINP